MQRSREEKVFGEIRLARPAKAEVEAPLPEPRRVHCPLCKNVIVIPDEQKPADLDCILCGMTFRFTPQQESVTDPPRSPLENWLSGKPLKLRRLNKWERFRRWCAERPYLVGTTAGMLMVLTLISWLSISAYRNACLHLREASQQLEQWQRQQAESPPAPAQNQPAQKIAAPTADPPAAIASETKPVAKAAAKPADPPATVAAQEKPAAKPAAKSPDSPALAASQNKKTAKPTVKPPSLSTAIAAADKKPPKTAAKPANPPATEANPSPEVALPTLGSAQRDATLR